MSFDNGVRSKSQNNSFLLVDQFEGDDEELSEEIDLDLLTVKGKGEIFDPIYEQEVEELKKKKQIK